MEIALVAAMAKHRVIGKDGKMPWHLPAELQYFKSVTLGKPVVMGRATYESIGRPLPGRVNIVLSRQYAQPHQDAQGVVWVNGPEQAIKAASTTEELMVIGGGKIYELFLPHATKLYLTEIDLEVEGDTWFPDYQALANWRVIDQQTHASDEKNPHSFVTKVLAKDLTTLTI